MNQDDMKELIADTQKTITERIAEWQKDMTTLADSTTKQINELRTSMNNTMQEIDRQLMGPHCRKCGDQVRSDTDQPTSVLCGSCAA